MATVNYKCPACGAPIGFNPDKQKFCCEYCFSEYTDEEIQKLYAEQEAKTSQAEEQEKKAQENKGDEEEAVVYNCPSCGAEVVTTATTAATTCFYCHNPVVMGGRLSGDFKPDRIIPFALSKEKAVESFMSLVKKKKFLPSDFASENQIEKMQGVYFPYWYIDSQQEAHMTAMATKVRTWRSGNKRYTETSKYRVVRGGDVVIKNVFERALKSTDRDMLQCVHPFDLTKAKGFSMSYLSGFQAEKRDIEKADIQAMVDKRIDEYCQQVLKDTIKGYNSVTIESYNDHTELENWSCALLPVWVLTYKYKNKIFPYAVNGQTGKTYGSLPVSLGKIIALGAIVAVVVFILGTLGGLFLI